MAVLLYWGGLALIIPKLVPFSPLRYYSSINSFLIWIFPSEPWQSVSLWGCVSVWLREPPTSPRPSFTLSVYLSQGGGKRTTIFGIDCLIMISHQSQRGKFSWKPEKLKFSGRVSPCHSRRQAAQLREKRRNWVFNVVENVCLFHTWTSGWVKGKVWNTTQVICPAGQTWGKDKKNTDMAFFVPTWVGVPKWIPCDRVFLSVSESQFPHLE